MLLIKSTETRNNAKDTVLTRGSIDCKNPFFKAISSERIDSFKKARALVIERSIKLLFLKLKDYSPFFTNFFPINHTTITIIAIPRMAEII